MKTRTKRILAIVGLFFICVITVLGWTTIKVVAWARDLPNRIVIDGDAMLPDAQQWRECVGIVHFRQLSLLGLDSQLVMS